MSFAVKVLRKYKDTLELNIHGTQGMIINEQRISDFKKQVRELKKAIEYLEFIEFRMKKKESE